MLSGSSIKLTKFSLGIVAERLLQEVWRVVAMWSHSSITEEMLNRKPEVLNQRTSTYLNHLLDASDRSDYESESSEGESNSQDSNEVSSDSDA
jgi:hypothetical protein